MRQERPLWHPGGVQSIAGTGVRRSPPPPLATTGYCLATVRVGLVVRFPEVKGLDAEIAVLEAVLQEGRGAADTGERARDNVRKALALVLRQLREGGPEEKAFAEHLRTHLSIGQECLYSQPEGRVWR